MRSKKLRRACGGNPCEADARHTVRDLVLDEMRVAQKNKLTYRWARKIHAPVPPTINGPNRPICSVRSVPNAEPAPPSCCRMQLHLDEIATKVTLGAHAIILLDQAGWHGAKALVVPNNISLVPLPPRAPEL